MSLSTPAKIGLTLLGTATLIGVGVAISRTGDKPDDAGASGTKAPDSSAPKVAEEVLDIGRLFSEMGDRVEQAEGVQIVVGTRYLLPFAQAEAAQIRSGARRIASFAASRVENMEAAAPQRWEISTPTFEVELDGFTVGFRGDTQTLYVQASRAGQYAIAMRDQDGVEFYDDLLFRADSGGLPGGNA